MSVGLLGSSIVWFREGFEIYLIVQMAFLMIQNKKQSATLLASTLLGAFSAIVLALLAKDFVQKDFAFVEAVCALVASGLLFWTAWYCHGAQKNVEELKKVIRFSSVLFDTKVCILGFLNVILGNITQFFYGNILSYKRGIVQISNTFQFSRHNQILFWHFLVYSA